MAEEVVLQNYAYHCDELIRCNSGAITFHLQSLHASFWLTAKEEPFKELYEIQIGTVSKFVNLIDNTEVVTRSLDITNADMLTPFWLTWYNYTLRFGPLGQKDPILEMICTDREHHNQIGYVKFHSPITRFTNATFKVEVPPILHMPDDRITRNVKGGDLFWVRMNNHSPLPNDALIGGFQGIEPTYIARADHNNSLCPGKYVRSKRCAFVPWGFQEHVKNECEILCGFNSQWVKTRGNKILPNAFVAGYSEVRQEPLYIGRAMHDNNLITGKVHALYKTCYLPYGGCEIEVGSYEILVVPFDKPYNIIHNYHE